MIKERTLPLPSQVMPAEIRFFPWCSLRYLAHHTSRLFTKMILSCPCGIVIITRTVSLYPHVANPSPAMYSRYQFFVGTYVKVFFVISRNNYVIHVWLYLAQFSSQTICLLLRCVTLFCVKIILNKNSRRTHCQKGGYEKKIS